jgi:transcriptional regulator GlxA family with amidase domain
VAAMPRSARILPMFTARDRTVAMVVFDRINVFEMAVPCEVFGLDRSDMGLPNYRLLIAAAEPGELHTQAKFRIEAPYGLSALRRAGTVIVPAWRDVKEVPPAPLLRALRDAHRRGARIVSLCSGAFVLAHAGLLDGRRATTHWMYARQFASTFPAVQLDPNVLYVDEGSVLTSAGTAAGIDLCLHIVRKDLGAKVANQFARRMVVPPHRDGGQAQFIQTPMPVMPTDRLEPTMAWAAAHLKHPLTVQSMAAHAHMSPRTFARRFKAGAGTTPLRWLLAQRLAATERLLETTDLDVDRIAEEAGLGSAANLRLHFARVLSTTPSAYRRAFSGRMRSTAPELQTTTLAAD